MKTKPKTYWIAKNVDGYLDHLTLSKTKNGVFELFKILPWNAAVEKQDWKIVKVKLVEIGKC